MQQTHVFESIAPSGSLREQVEASLSAAIIAGQVEPGDLLTVPTLATQYNVSATPVREAILNLARRGFVEPVRNKGFRVTEVSQKELADLVEIRRLLEAPTMRTVAEKFDAGERPRFDALVEQMRVAAESRDFVTYFRSDNGFHLGLLEFVGNDKLTETVHYLREQTRTTGLAAHLGRSELDHTIQEHVDLLDLVVAGDGEGAERLMRHHIGHVLGWWSGRAEP